MIEISESSLYQSVEAALTLMDCDIGAAECHGILCGMLCGVRHFEASVWLGHTTGYHDDVSFSDLGSGHALSQLLSETTSGYTADDFSLQLLLPDDDSPFEVRTEALGSWCRGFLSGLGLTDLGDIRQLSDDSRGFLRDIEEIGKVEAVETDDNSDETALMEICEYTRMGALLLYEETQFAAGADPGGETIH
jgi:uncharacterized protein YgfB (UPF0149 family)